MMTYPNYSTQHSATAAMKSFLITSSEKLKTTQDYQKVASIVYKLMEGGVTFAAKGYCISMSDIVYTLLKQNGIPCRILECQLAITNKTNGQINVVGFDHLKDDPSRTDTHVVVVTETEVPMIIDVSIAHLLPNNLQGVIDELVDDSHGRVFANIETQAVSLTYQNKNVYSIPMLHQRSIVDRIQTDVNIFKNLRMLRVMIIIAITVSVINAARGFYDFYSVYVLENHWGPNAIKQLTEKVDEVDQKINTIVNKNAPVDKSVKSPR